MLGPILAATVLSVGVSLPAFAQECLHGPNETVPERARREQAVQFAHRLNAAQHSSLPGLQGRTYRPLEELRNLPPVPPGFRLQFVTDGRGYAFTLKDERDACRFALFSDQDGVIYGGVPQPRTPTVIPLDKT